MTYADLKERIAGYSTPLKLLVLLPPLLGLSAGVVLKGADIVRAPARVEVNSQAIEGHGDEHVQLNGRLDRFEVQQRQMICLQVNDNDGHKCLDDQTRRAMERDTL